MPRNNNYKPMSTQIKKKGTPQLVSPRDPSQGLKNKEKQNDALTF